MRLPQSCVPLIINHTLLPYSRWCSIIQHMRITWFQNVCAYFLQCFGTFFPVILLLLFFFFQKEVSLFSCLLFYRVVSKYRLSRSIFQLSLSLELWPFQVYISLGLKFPMMSSRGGPFLERCSAQHNVSTLAWVPAGFNKDMLTKHTHNSML